MRTVVAALQPRIDEITGSGTPAFEHSRAAGVLEIVKAAMHLCGLLRGPIMLAIAGTMALLLRIFGLYGVLVYTISLRRREIGIRLALG